MGDEGLALAGGGFVSGVYGHRTTPAGSLPAAPKLPLVSVSSHTLGTTVVRGVHRVREVVFVVDADGHLWRKEANDSWERMYGDA